MKRKFLISLLALTLLFNVTPASAATLDNTNNSIAGGWDEETGYFSTTSEYNKSLKSNVGIAATASHTGEREEKVINGTTNARAHGWTTWVGVYHYTRARMEDGWSDDILTDSGRVWGNDGTEAISPWLAFNPDVWDRARTYYGN